MFSIHVFAGPVRAQTYLLGKLCVHASFLLRKDLQQQSKNKAGLSSGAAFGGYGSEEWQSSSKGEDESWAAADYAQLLWGLGSTGHVPPKNMMQLVCR